jgi:septum formation protein
VVLIPCVTTTKESEEDAKESLKILNPVELANELAYLKAKSLETPEHCVLGGDQLVSFKGQILGKPQTENRAIEMLSSMQGDTHQLITSICLLFAGKKYNFTDIAQMKMKPLSYQQIKRYVDHDRPLDCAGSYKIESRGIVLFEEIQCSDFSAIQGIPLMKLAFLLENCGHEIP